jgi:hypothetical protein
MEEPDRETRQAASDPRGLCPRCRHVKIVTSGKGSVFFLCLLSAADPRFPKYPPQPVVSCDGFEG